MFAMGFLKLFLNLGIYLTAFVGVFTLLPFSEDNVFTKYSIASERSLTGPLASNEKLVGMTKLFEGRIQGPESLLYHNKTLYTTVHNGYVMKIVDDQLIPFVQFGKPCVMDGYHESHICGRPLGLNMDKHGFLYVADGYYGIFKVNVNSNDQYGAIEQIVSMDETIDGVRPKFPNCVVVGTDGAVYRTDSSTSHGLDNSIYPLMFVKGTGRLIKYDPQTKTNTVLIKNLMFANGVQLSDDESFIIVAETSKYRIHKYHLKGPNVGISEIFIDGLPGMPDNIKKNGKGSFYIPLVVARHPAFENIGEYPTIRMMCAKFLELLEYTFKIADSFFPDVYWKKVDNKITSFESLGIIIQMFMTQQVSIIKINEKGTIISNWYSTNDNISIINDVEVVDDKLFLGSPMNNYLGVCKVPNGF